MQDSVEKKPLISIYRSLSKSAVRRLGKWLDSPAHNQRQDVRDLHDYLSKRDRLLKTPALSKTRIWTAIFPGEKFDDAKLRQTFYWALKASQEFLAYERWQQDEIGTQLALITELRERNLADEATRVLKRTQKLQQSIPAQNEKYFRDQYSIELARDELRSYYKLRETPRFQEISDTLDVTYFIEKLKASGNMMFQQRVYKTSFRFPLIAEVVGAVEQLDLSNYPVLAIHYYGYRGQTEDDASGEVIGLLREAFSKHGDLLSAKDKRYFILLAINICIPNINRGRQVFIRESFEWYKIGLSNDALTQDGLLTRETYLNVVFNAFKLSEYGWAEAFINEYSSKLEESIRHNTEYFAKARLSYHLKDYDNAMRQLARTDFKHPVYNLLAKTQLLKIYYELDEYDAMDSQLDSMTTYVRRKDIAQVRKDNFNNIVRSVRQLIRIAPGDRDKLQALRQKVQKLSPLTEKVWVLKRIDDKLGGR